MTADAGSGLRCVVAAPMKSASTFVAETLRRYFEAEISNREIVGYYFPAEQNLTPDLLQQLAGKTFALNMHMRPYPHNLAAARRHRVQIVPLWRNLGDVIVSFDEHVRDENEENPVFYIADRGRYLALPAEERYAYLIDNLVPWNLGFYLAWRRERVALHAYELLAEAPFDYLTGVVRALGTAIDEERLAAAAERSPQVRFNVGRTGRSARLMTPSNQRHLERVVLDHPQRGELEVLLWELPWDVPLLRPHGPHDGKVVRGDDDPLYFVSRGVRRRVGDPTWIHSRARLSREPPDRLSAGELEAIPEGSPLV